MDTVGIKKNYTPKQKLIRKVSKIGILISILVMVIGVGYFFRLRTLKKEDLNASSYYAVFLTNGQVYFGNLDSLEYREMVFSKVYYLQSQNQNQVNPINNSAFTLVKLGQELHGPTEKLYINRDQIVFYERLRKDSTVVQSIEKNL